MKLETRQNVLIIGCSLYVYAHFRMHIMLFISFTEIIFGFLSSHYRPVKIINNPKAFSHQLQDKRRMEVWGGISIRLPTSDGHLFFGISQTLLP
jgi:hypothetical protein